MQGLPKDITNIIHRIVWSLFIEQCSAQYHELFELTDNMLLDKTTLYPIFNYRPIINDYKIYNNRIGKNFYGESVIERTRIIETLYK